MQIEEENALKGTISAKQEMVEHNSDKNKEEEESQKKMQQLQLQKLQKSIVP